MPPTPAAQPGVSPIEPVEGPGASDREAGARAEAAVPAAARMRRRRQAPRRAERRPARTEEVDRLRRLTPEQYLDLSLEDGFALTRDLLSKGGTNESWLRNSARGFDAAGTLAMSHFGAKTRVRDVTLADCRDYVEALGSVQDNWGKNAALTRPMSELIAMANDKEEAELVRIEQLAESEDWSTETFLAACEKARVKRLAPANQYKHQCYLNAAVKTVFRFAKAGEHPMQEAIWKKKYLKQLKAQGPAAPPARRGRARRAPLAPDLHGGTGRARRPAVLGAAARPLRGPAHAGGPAAQAG
jgi:hypothetical protein